eukprot:31323-Pelagococcus_subviridis.AAC.24
MKCHLTSHGGTPQARRRDLTESEAPQHARIRVLLHLLRFPGIALAETLPESQRLVRGGGDDGRPVRALRHVQNPRGVSGELRHLRHRRVFPKAQLVLRVTVGR